MRYHLMVRRGQEERACGATTHAAGAFMFGRWDTAGRPVGFDGPEVAAKECQACLDEGGRGLRHILGAPCQFPRPRHGGPALPARANEACAQEPCA